MPAPTRTAGPLVAVLVLVSLAAPPAGAQAVASDTTAAGGSVVPATDPVDVRVLRAVYGVDAPAFRVPVRAVNDAAYPVFIGAAPALLAGSLVAGGDAGPALRLGAAEVLSFGVTYALKSAVRRPRPYAVLDGVAARDRGHMGDDVFDPHSFPSGHTSMAFVVATSLSLSYPEWYVVAPAAAWATAMGVARVWHGVHYPTDVAAGALVGVASGAVVHVLLADVLGGSDDGPARGAVPFQVVVPL